MLDRANFPLTPESRAQMRVARRPPTVSRTIGIREETHMHRGATRAHRLTTRAARVSIFLALLGCSPPESVGDFVAREEKLYSQGNEELLIRHFFGDRRDGFFLDVGSYKWKKISTTYYLEKHLGWSGIAIDANAKLAKGYEENRPRTRFFSYIITDHGGTKEDFYFAGPVSSTSEEHAGKFDMSSRKGRVPTLTLDTLLEREGVEEIDLLSMDIELGEPAALAGFDIDRYRPKLICIETGNTEVRKLIKPYFEKHGYERIEEYLEHDWVNWYYRPVEK
jgi:FkbM family methyltransferase